MRRIGDCNSACTRHARTLSHTGRIAAAAEQQESHHTILHGRSKSVSATHMIDWNVQQATASNASTGHHIC